ncbi:hypothetical protein BKA80DRAFT_187700, partial [Phyllosticta citrichinensis]
KRHAACDECRKCHRKLKCSGDKPRCGRCVRESITCVYSPQKQMGRPRKRRRDDASPIQLPPTHHHYGGGASGSSKPLMINDQSLSHSHSGQFSHEGTSAGGSGTCSRSESAFWMDSRRFADMVQRQDLSIDGSSSYHTPPLPAPHHEQPLIAPPLPPQCACLSTMYLTLTSLHSLSSHEFPFVLPTLRSAINTIATVIPCPQCPKRPVTATQNFHMLVSLLLGVVESLRATLVAIDTEAARVEAAGATKAIAMADAEMPMHMHTGTPDCPARFNMEMNGPDWRAFVRKALRDQVVGSPRYPGERTLYGIVVSLEERQRRWH